MTRCIGGGKKASRGGGTITKGLGAAETCDAEALFATFFGTMARGGLGKGSVLTISD